MLVVGDREADSGEVSVRAHGQGPHPPDAGSEPVASFAQRVVNRSKTLCS